MREAARPECWRVHGDMFPTAVTAEAVGARALPVLRHRRFVDLAGAGVSSLRRTGDHVGGGHVVL